MKLVITVLTLASVALADCIPFADAPKHIGESACVTGKVVKVGQSKAGTQFINFCDDYKHCAFTVVVFARNLRDVGDVRQLVGKEISIHGRITQYNGQAEIILKDVKQLEGGARMLPPLPKEYEASNGGHFSAGHFSDKKPSKSAHRKKQTDQPGEEDPAVPQ